MRRKSKKTKEEAKESSSERRSKRSSTRRKKTYEDDEGGSGVEEERTTEEEMTPTKAKDRGGRRYATRGRRQKAEESEDEEVSQAEEERVECEEESSNNLPVVSEAADRENEIEDRGDDSKGLKSGGISAVADKSTASEGNDGAGARKVDKTFWEMKSTKNDQEDKRGEIVEETPAQGEGDDGEEEGSRSHSRKRKVKLSRECLHESREAIPKIRLRLSRNRSGGYETEKLEAERIETKKADEETLVKVVKVEDVLEETEPKDSEQNVCAEPVEVIEAKVESSEAVKQGSEELQQVKVEAAEPREEKGQEEVCDTSPTVEEFNDSSASETQVKEEKCDNGVEIEELRTDEAAEHPVCDDGIEEVEGVVEFPKDSFEERTEQKTEVKMQVEESASAEDAEKDGAPAEVAEKGAPAEDAEKEVASGEDAEKDCATAEDVKIKDSAPAEDTESVSTLPVVKEEEDEKEVESESQAQAPHVVQEVEEEERVAEESQDKQVSGGASEVSDSVVKEEKEKNHEESKVSDLEKPKDSEKEESDVEEEVKGDPEEVVKESESDKVGEGAIITKETEDAEPKSKDENCIKGHKAVETADDKEKLPNKGESEQVKVQTEKVRKSGSGERASRINRAKLRQDDDVEEAQDQKRRRRRRSKSRESSGSGSRRQSTTSTTSDQPQPKRVTLKRPKLIRSTSSVSIKDTIATEEKEHKEDNTEKDKEGDEEENHSLTTSEVPQLIDKEECKSSDPSTLTEEGTKKRRRKWGQQKSQVGPSQSKRAFISISTQSLKGLIPEVKPLPIHELRLSIEKDDVKDICMEEEESCEASVDETIVRMIDANGQNERTVWAQVVDDEMRPTIHPEGGHASMSSSGDAVASAGPVRRISIVSDDAVRLQRSPSPPRHPPSSVLFLSNLVRPFTVQQLKELLARTGTVVEDGFWIDRIKSMCLVQYETEEQARETRHALHGVRWPISNPKRLWVDFATKERLEEAKREGNVPPPPPATGPSLTPPHPPPRDDFPRKTEPLRVEGSGMAPIHHATHRGTPSSPGRQGHTMILQQGPIISGVPASEASAPGDNVGWQQRGRPRPEGPPLRPGTNARDFKLSAPVREWDLDKVVQQSPPRPGVHGPSRAPMDDRRRPDTSVQTAGRRDRMLPSPPPSLQEMQARKAKRKEAEAAAAAEAPANLLDSLFRKTKATPSIYWLPLTAEQIKVKEEIRRQHLAEHERRMAEMKRAAEKERGGRRRRHSSSPRRRSRRRSGEGSSAVRKKPSDSMKGHKAGSASPKK